MALSNVTLSRSANGLGFPSANEDFISGMVIYNATLPTGLTNGQVTTIYSPEDAEALGIKGDYSGATSATGTDTVTAVGAAGDVIVIKLVQSPYTISLCTYTVKSTDTTVTLLAASICAEINKGTTGFTASNVAGVITYVAPKKYGSFFNAVVTTKVITGTVTFSAGVAFSGGVKDNNKQYHYYISEYFRANPSGTLWLMWSTVISGYTFSQVYDLQIASVGKIRQCMVSVEGTTYSASQVTILQSIYDQLSDLYMPMELILQTAFTDTVATIADLSTYTASDVIVNTACDMGGTGYFLSNMYGKTIGAGGYLLGTISASKVSDSIAWVAQYNASDGAELESIGVLNLVQVSTLSEASLVALENKRYTFLRKFVGRSGSYWNDDNTAIAPTSDYSKVRLNRTIDKAIRLVRAAMLPRLNSPVIVNSDGSLSGDVIDDFTTACLTPLDSMLSAGEVSDRAVVIDPNQDVITTSTLYITIKIIPVGATKFINVKVGFTTKL
jgi:hypothetical protein